MSAFKRARTKEKIEERKEKIVSIALSLYDKGGYSAVTFSSISQLTNFTRPAIYSYFKNPDDILLYGLGKDFYSLNKYLEGKLEASDYLSINDFVDVIYEGFIAYPRLLKMLSINYSIIEIGSTKSELVSFKSHIMRTFEIFDLYVRKFFTYVNKERRVDFSFMIFSFLSSVYTLTNPSLKQIEAIRENNEHFRVPSFEHLCYEGIKTIVKSLEKA